MYTFPNGSSFRTAEEVGGPVRRFSINLRESVKVHLPEALGAITTFPTNSAAVSKLGSDLKSDNKLEATPTHLLMIDN